MWLLDVPVDLLSLAETIARAEAAMSSRQPVRHVALNVAKLVKLRDDPELRRDVVESDMVGIDGMGIVFALRLFGCRDVQRVSGVDLMVSLLAHCAATGRRPYVLGAKRIVLERAAQRAIELYPGLRFAGLQDGYFSAGQEDEVVATIRQSGADCLFVAMPTPKKERFLHRNAAALGVPFTMGVGGSIDVLAGAVRRAPSWMQHYGLEWLHRLLQEPRKMTWRYLSTNSRFAVILAGALVRRDQPVRGEGHQIR